MVKGIFLYAFLLLVLAITGFSQKPDSLEILLNRKDDTVKVNLLNSISDIHLRKGNYEKSEQSALDAKLLAEELDYAKGVYFACRNLFLGRYAKGKYSSCLEVLREEIEAAEEMNRMDLVIESKLSLATTYRALHFNARAAELSLEAGAIATKLNDKRTLALALSHLPGIYSQEGNYELTNKYSFKLIELWKELNDSLAMGIWYSNIAESYADMEKYDSAIFYHKLAIETYTKTGESLNTAYLFMMTGRTYKKMKNYKQAIFYFNKAIDWHKHNHESPGIYASSLLNISEILIEENRKSEGRLQDDLKPVIQRLDTAIQIFKSRNSYPSLLRAYSAMREINERTGNYKKANEYLKEVLITQDTLNNREQKTKLGELMIQYQVKENEQQIVQLQKEKSTNRLLILILSGSLLLVIFSIALFVSRQKLRYRNEKRELELSALRAQMNPHFIFNCLSSISFYIIHSEVGKATDYLTKFAKLMRSILDNSKRSLVSLADEIRTLSLYIDLEAIRFNIKFSYNIKVEDDVDAESIMLSPMIVQPFVENAIWHGLQHKSEPGHISIDFAIRNKSLLCTIQDNGVGRKKTLELHTSSSISKKPKSYGIQITKERLNLLARKGLKTSLEITDLIDENNNPLGTKVEIALPLQKLS